MEQQNDPIIGALGPPPSTRFPPPVSSSRLHIMNQVDNKLAARPQTTNKNVMANAGRQIIESGPPMFKDLLKRPPVQQDQAKPVTRPWAVQKPVHQSQNARDDLDDDSDEEDDDTMLMGADRDD